MVKQEASVLCTQEKDYVRYVYFCIYRTEWQSNTKCGKKQGGIYLLLRNAFFQGPSAPAEANWTDCNMSFIGLYLCFLRLFIEMAWVFAIIHLHLNKPSGFELCFFSCITWELHNDVSSFLDYTSHSNPLGKQPYNLSYRDTLCFKEKKKRLYSRVRDLILMHTYERERYNGYDKKSLPLSDFIRNNEKHKWVKQNKIKFIRVIRECTRLL